MNEKNQISAKQLGLYIMVSQVGMGVIFAPPRLAQYSGHDGWISLIIGGILSSGALMAIILLVQRYPDQSIYQINRRLFGKVVGVMLNMLLLLYLLYLASMAIRYFAEYVQLIQMSDISLTVISTLIIVPTIYITTKGLPAVCNFSVHMLFILGLIVVLGALLMPLHWNFLLPVGVAGGRALLKNIPDTFFSFIGFELVAFLYPLVKDKQRVMFWTVGANLVTMCFFILVFILSVGQFGEVFLKKLVTPLFQLSQFIPFGRKERLELFFALLWFPFLESSFRCYYYTAFTGCVDLFGIKKRKRFLALFTFALIIGSLIPRNFNQVFLFAESVKYFGMVVVGLLLVCSSIAFWKGSGKA